MRLRPYQSQGIDRLRAAYAQGARAVLCVAPTGAGKTVVASEIIRQAVAKGTRVLFLAHRTELIDQCAGKLQENAVEHGVIQGTRPQRPEAPVQVASVQTLARRQQIPDVDLIVTDECHHQTAASYQRITGRYPDARLLGLTATPYRLDGSGLGTIYQAMEVLATIPELIAGGFLVPPEVWGTPRTPDMQGVRRRGGDFAQGEAADMVDRPHLVGDVVRTWADRALDRTTVVFAASVEHSRHLVAAFNAAGVRAAHLDAQTPADDRALVLAGLAGGRLSAVSNVGLLTEGWDLPRCACVSMARPTASRGLYMQMAGRGLRTCQGKDDCLILDHVGNTARHGFVTDHQSFTLADGAQEPQGPAPARMCPRCYAYQPSALRSCQRCGYEWPARPAERRMIEQRDGQLVRLLSADAARGVVDARGKADALIRLRAEAAQAGRRPTWASTRFREIYGHWPDSGAVMAAMEGAPR